MKEYFEKKCKELRVNHKEAEEEFKASGIKVTKANITKFVKGLSRLYLGRCTRTGEKLYR